MKKVFVLVAGFGLCCVVAFGADSTLPAMTADTSPAATDITYKVNTAGDTESKSTLGNIITKAHGLTGYGEYIRLDSDNVMEAAPDLKILGYTSSVGYTAGQVVAPEDACASGGAITTATLGNGGTGYIVGDVVHVLQSGAGTGYIKVATISGSAIATFTVYNGGNGYSIADGLATSGGHGSGATINITDASTNPTFCRGVYNTSIGGGAAKVLTVGKLNTIVGVDAGTTLANGSYNTLLGTDAGQLGTAFSYVTAIGTRAATNNQASEITAFGYGSLEDSTTGIGNIGIGIYSYRRATTANYNTAVGSYSMGVGVMTNSTGDGNTGTGYYSLYNNTGAKNVGVGSNALKTKTSGDRNTMVGESAGFSLQTGGFNTAVGQMALWYPNGASSYNTAIGYNAGPGSAAVFSSTLTIGANAVPTANNQGVIGGGNANGKITDLYLGQGVAMASPDGITVNASGGSGTDNAGGSLTLAGGKGTGAGAGGDVIIKAAPAGSSADTLNALEEKARFPVAGGLKLMTGTKPTCAEGVRGTLFYVAGGVGVADTMEVCRKDASNNYAWVGLF